MQFIWVKLNLQTKQRRSLLAGFTFKHSIQHLLSEFLESSFLELLL